MLGLRGLCAGLDTLTDLAAAASSSWSSCKSLGSPLHVLALADRRRRLSGPVEAEEVEAAFAFGEPLSGIPGSEGARCRRCLPGWCAEAAAADDGDPGFGG